MADIQVMRAGEKNRTDEVRPTPKTGNVATLTSFDVSNHGKVAALRSAAARVMVVDCI